MKIQQRVRCTGIKASKGQIDGGNAYDSTTFHLVVDIAENSTGTSIGSVSRPFKFGDSTEILKWAGMKETWPEAGIQTDCEFDLVAGAENKSTLVLKGIRPAAPAKA